MVTMKPIIIGFMTLCISCYVQSGLAIQPRSYLDDLELANLTAGKQIEVIKRLVKFDADQIYDREWAMVQNTCKEMRSVWVNMEKNIRNDLALFMRDVQENAQHDPPPEDKGMGECLKRAKGHIDRAIQEGVDWFTECIDLPKALQMIDEKKLNKMQHKYKLSVGYTLSKVENCQRYSNVHSSGQLYNCLQGTVAETEKQFAKTTEVFKEGKCISHFTEILYCVDDVFNQTAVKKELVKEDIAECTGITYGFKPEKEKNLGVNVSNILLRHSEYYKNLINHYNTRLHQGFHYLNMVQLHQESVQNTHEDKLGAYYDALKKGLIDNWSPEGKKCHLVAKSKLDTLKKEEEKDYKECENNYYKQITNCINEYVQMAKEFNQKLQAAGNVALLKCFGDRPQDILNSKSIEQCVNIANRRIGWEYEKTMMKEQNLLKYLDFSYILSKGQTCRGLRYKKLILEADSVLNDYSRCLYGVSGDLYVLTTPTTTSITSTSSTTTRITGTSPTTTSITSTSHTTTRITSTSPTTTSFTSTSPTTTSITSTSPTTFKYTTPRRRRQSSESDEGPLFILPQSYSDIFSNH